MSAFGGRADIFQGAAKSPLIARSGHAPSNTQEINQRKINGRAGDEHPGNAGAYGAWVHGCANGHAGL